MARRNDNARKGKCTLPTNTHLMYNVGFDTRDDVIVRYMGEQDEDTLLVWHPDGFEMWTHIAHLSRFNRKVVLT